MFHKIEVYEFLNLIFEVLITILYGSGHIPTNKPYWKVFKCMKYKFYQACAE